MNIETTRDLLAQEIVSYCKAKCLHLDGIALHLEAGEPLCADMCDAISAYCEVHSLTLGGLVVAVQELYAMYVKADQRDVLAEVVEAAQAGDLGAQMALAEAIEVPTDADLAYINANEALVTAEQEARSIGMEVALHKSCHSSLSLDFSYALNRYQTSGSVQELWYVKYFAAQIIAGADAYV